MILREGTPPVSPDLFPNCSSSRSTMQDVEFTALVPLLVVQCMYAFCSSFRSDTVPDLIIASP